MREKQRAFTRKELIRAAREVFANKGFDQAGVDEIAALAGVSRATFYLHFQQKADIATALNDEVWEQALAFFLELGDLLEWTLEHIATWISTDVQSWKGRKSSATVLKRLSLAVVQDDVRQRVASIAAAMVERGGPWADYPQDQAVLRARTVVDVLVRYNEHWLVDGFVSDRERDLSLVAQVVLSALVAPVTPQGAARA